MDPSKVTHLNFPRGDRNDKTALITPFKLMQGKQPYDSGNNVFAVPNLWGGYWGHWDWNKAIADGMRSAGATVVVCDVNNLTNPDYVCDVSNSREVEAMFTRIAKDLGGLDILVNNVGVPGPTARVDEMDPEAYDECVRVNLGGTFRCAHAAVPMLIKSKGSMVNISTSAGIYGYPLRSPYVAAKWGIIGLTKSWAMELGEFGVRVNAICPGSVSGPRMDGVIEREAKATGLSAD